jgi:hypothetical protein
VRDTNQLPARVESHLMKSAARPPNLASPKSTRGLPGGWVLYHDVQIANVDVLADSEDLECLVPLGAGSVLEVTGGLELTPSFYHTIQPPSARLVVPSGYAAIAIVPLGSDEDIAKSAPGGTEITLSLGGNTRGHTDLQVRAIHDGKIVDDIPLYLRDANNPPPMARDRRGQLRYSSITTAMAWDSSNEGLFGFSVPADLANTLQKRSLVAPADSALPTGDEEVSQAAMYSKAIEQQVISQGCIQAGYHYRIFPMIERDTAKGTPIRGRCRNCRDELVVLYRIKKKPPARARIVSPSRIKLTDIPQPSNVESTTIDHDLLFDALSFLGYGSWSKFDTLLASITPTPEYPRQIAQDYMALGLLDLELRKGTGAYRSWCVPQPSLNFVSRNRAFLSGFRSNTLVDELRTKVTQAGGELEILTQNGAPQSVFVNGLTPDALREAIEGMQDPHQRQMLVIERPAASLASACARMLRLDDCLSPVSIGRARNLQSFNVQSARWEDVEAARGIGCYRWNEGAQAYGYVDNEGNAFAGPHQVVKLLAARSAGIRLHAYDSSTQSFHSTLGCEPVGLLSRTLVACSGKLPSIARGRTSYTAIPPDIAATVLAILYDGATQ